MTVCIVKHQRTNTAHLGQIQHTFGANIAHLHTVWKILHTFSLDGFTINKYVICTQADIERDVTYMHKLAYAKSILTYLNRLVSF